MNALRKLHLYAAFGLLSLLSMYAVSGFVMIHGSWFPPQHGEKRVEMEPLEGLAGGPTEETAIKLLERFGLNGKREPPQRLRDGRIGRLVQAP